jgi:hypothetical protein
MTPDDMAKITANARAELTLALVASDIDPDVRTHLLEAAEKVWAQVEEMWSGVEKVYEDVERIVARTDVLLTNNATLRLALIGALDRWSVALHLVETNMYPNAAGLVRDDRAQIDELRKLLA